jgi:hypothetical protein
MVRLLIASKLQSLIKWSAQMYPACDGVMNPWP